MDVYVFCAVLMSEAVISWDTNLSGWNNQFQPLKLNDARKYSLMKTCHEIVESPNDISGLKST